MTAATERRGGQWLAEATLHLATPAALIHGLGLLGIKWDLHEGATEAELPSEPGLYAWVDGGERNVDHKLAAPILYIGKAAGAEGLKKRVSDERGWATEEYLHGHARTMFRRRAGVVGGVVSLNVLDRESYSQIADKYSNLKPTAEAAFEWLTEEPSSILSRVERIAVRLTIHLGDTGAPVNSHFAGAWDIKSFDASAADLLALFAYERMTNTDLCANIED